MTVAWISFFPIEWLDGIPSHLRSLPREHPATWQRVLLAELERDPAIQLHIVALRKHLKKSETFERNGVVFHLIKTIGGLRAPTIFWSDTWLIGRILRSIGPDVVHAWGTEKGAGLVASRLQYPYILTMQGLLGWLSELTRLDMYHRFAALLERRTLRRASIVTVESSFGVSYLKQRYPNLDLHQVEHAPLPLFRRIERRPQSVPVRFLFVGSFTYGKGVDVMLKALDRFKEETAFELVVVGHVDDSASRSLKTEVSSELWKRVRFTGNLPAERIADELAVATIVLYPTRCDNSPNSVKEAVVAGVPVVASAIGGIPDYVWPARNGVLFQPGDIGECLTAIRTACNHPLFSRGLVASSSLNDARDYLSPHRMTHQFVDLYGQAARK
jgi:glycosyltransferase involved in cell wall biosynthesis